MTPPIRKLLFFAGAACLVASIVLSEPQRNDLSAKDRSRVLAVTAPTENFTRPEPFEAMSGGAATSTAKPDGGAFSHASATMPFERRQDFKLGNALFQKLWVSSPSSTQASDGLGPLYSARACQTCHVKDGRGRPPLAGEDPVSMFLRLARPPRNEAEQQALERREVLNFPDETYGRQLQTLAIPGLAAEGRPVIAYTESAVRLADGEVVMLRKPDYGVTDPKYGALGGDTTISARIAMPTLGLGLIEAIAEEDILAGADPDDKNGDGISGRPAFTRDHRTKAVKLGRFGWKAQNASVRDQSADAFSHDIGISTPDALNANGDCTDAQKDCLVMPTGVQPRLGTSEAPDPVLDLVTFYAENLAVPQRRNVGDPLVLHGKQLFYAAGCAACHTPKFVTRRDAASLSLIHI